MNQRTAEFIEDEIKTISEYCERVFGVALDRASLHTLIGEMVSDKVEDYLFQRFRDWPVKDLLLLDQVLKLFQENQPLHDEDKPKRRKEKEKPLQ